jgi:hypothetical protein
MFIVATRFYIGRKIRDSRPAMKKILGSATLFCAKKNFLYRAVFTMFPTFNFLTKDSMALLLKASLSPPCLQRGIIQNKIHSTQQCCGSGSARRRNFLQDQDPELGVLDPDPAPDLNLTKNNKKLAL